MLNRLGVCKSVNTYSKNHLAEESPNLFEFSPPESDEEEIPDGLH